MNDEAASNDYQLNLNDPKVAYLFGFLQADGHLYETTRNRGRLGLELSIRDAWLVEQFALMVPFRSTVRTRTRRTNFAEQHASVIWSVHDLAFRRALVQAGFAVGRKSETLAEPAEVSRVDYYRGILDADGSLGVTTDGFPFVSLVTASAALAFGYVAFVDELTGCRKRPERNKRDSVFNIAVFKEDAQGLARHVYYEGCLALPRKLARVPAMLQWERPATMRRGYRKQNWCEAQDEYILSHSVDESARHLNRTLRSVKMRLWRLQSANR